MNKIKQTFKKAIVENPIFDCYESGSTLRFLIPISLTKYD